MNRRPRLPIFFKLWFAFVAVCGIGVIGGFIYLLAAVIEAGPEGIGAELGRAVKAFNEAAQ